MKYYKTVLIPIKVSEGNYCWGDGRICEHFDNEYGIPDCDLSNVIDFFKLKTDDKGRVLKPKACKNLKEI